MMNYNPGMSLQDAVEKAIQVPESFLNRSNMNHTKVMSLQDAIDMALRVPEVGTINLVLLKDVLRTIVRHLDIDDCQLDTTDLANTSIPTVSEIIELGSPTNNSDTAAEMLTNLTSVQQRTEHNKSDNTVVVESTKDANSQIIDPIVKERIENLEAEVGQLKTIVTDILELPSDFIFSELMRTMGYTYSTSAPTAELQQFDNLSKRLDAVEASVATLTEQAKNKLVIHQDAVDSVSNQTEEEVETDIIELQDTFSGVMTISLKSINDIGLNSNNRDSAMTLETIFPSRLESVESNLNILTNVLAGFMDSVEKGFTNIPIEHVIVTQENSVTDDPDIPYTLFSEDPEENEPTIASQSTSFVNIVQRLEAIEQHLGMDKTAHGLVSERNQTSNLPHYDAIKQLHKHLDDLELTVTRVEQNVNEGWERIDDFSHERLINDINKVKDWIIHLEEDLDDYNDETTLKLNELFNTINNMKDDPTYMRVFQMMTEISHGLIEIIDGDKYYKDEIQSHSILLEQKLDAILEPVNTILLQLSQINVPEAEDVPVSEHNPPSDIPDNTELLVLAQQLRDIKQIIKILEHFILQAWERICDFSYSEKLFNDLIRMKERLNHMDDKILKITHDMNKTLEHVCTAINNAKESIETIENKKFNELAHIMNNNKLELLKYVEGVDEHTLLLEKKLVPLLECKISFLKRDDEINFKSLAALSEKVTTHEKDIETLYTARQENLKRQMERKLIVDQLRRELDNIKLVQADREDMIQVLVDRVEPNLMLTELNKKISHQEIDKFYNELTTIIDDINNKHKEQETPQQTIEDMAEIKPNVPNVLETVQNENSCVSSNQDLPIEKANPTEQDDKKAQRLAYKESQRRPGFFWVPMN